MAVKKPKRGSPAIDMTAMVDVAFLLLTFFILTTTKFREDQKVEVDTPSSVSSSLPPETGLMTIFIDPSGKTFVGYSDIDTREAVLEKAIAEKQLSIPEDGAGYFSTLENFGVPIDELESWLSLSHDEMTNYENPGVPIPENEKDTTTNQLKDWIRWGRLSDQRMRFAIKGDRNTSYEQIAQAIDALQDWRINQFSLITTMKEGGGMIEEEE